MVYGFSLCSAKIGGLSGLIGLDRTNNNNNDDTERDWKEAEIERETDKPTNIHTYVKTRKYELGELINSQIFSGSNKFTAQGRHITWSCE